MRIKAIRESISEPVYDITVADAHHYVLENGVITHNSGLEYAASTIIFLSKKKEKQGDEHVGNIITAKLQKSRQTIENKKVETLLYFDRGLDKYYGLLDLAENAGLVKKVANKYEFPDGTKAFENAIIKNPEKYFSEPLLKQIDEACKKEFLYGQSTKEQDQE